MTTSILESSEPFPEPLILLRFQYARLFATDESRQSKTTPLCYCFLPQLRENAVNAKRTAEPPCVIQSCGARRDPMDIQPAGQGRDLPSTNQESQERQEREEEARKIRRLQLMISMVTSVISQDPSLTVEEASELAAGAKRAALAMFPDKELAFDLIYRPRLQRLIRERYRLQ
jgi:hypothetical protein